MIVTITMDDITCTESVVSELSEVLKDLRDAGSVKSFAIREISMGIAVSNETFEESMMK